MFRHFSLTIPSPIASSKWQNICLKIKAIIIITLMTDLGLFLASWMAQHDLLSQMGSIHVHVYFSGGKAFMP